MKFALKGNKERKVAAAHSRTKMAIKGHFTIQGPQIVGGDGGAPEWVYDLFENNPHVEEVALNFSEGGVLYAPIKGDES